MLSGVFNAFSSGSIKARLRAVRAIAVAIPRVRAWATDFSGGQTLLHRKSVLSQGQSRL